MRHAKRRNKVKEKKILFKDPCTVEGCTGTSRHRRECITCEKLGREAFVRYACTLHVLDATNEVRKHALVSHPVNLLRWMGAALKGDL